MGDGKIRTERNLKIVLRDKLDENDRRRWRRHGSGVGTNYVNNRQSEEAKTLNFFSRSYPFVHRRFIITFSRLEKNVKFPVAFCNETLQLGKREKKIEASRAELQADQRARIVRRPPRASFESLRSL